MSTILTLFGLTYLFLDLVMVSKFVKKGLNENKKIDFINTIVLFFIGFPMFIYDTINEGYDNYEK